MSDPVYIIGIDLGTTNSVVAYTDAAIQKDPKPAIRVFEIPQLVGAGTVAKREVLPSFILVPGKHDVPEEALRVPWDVANSMAVGEFARDRGAEIPQRLISSSKSWLCHSMVDRNKPILPWEGPEEASKLSPVEASAAILRHIRDAWNHAMATTADGVDEKLKLENQDILLTVPASFDAVARDLTVQAATLAGLAHVTLLEEPQAAFYAWIESCGDGWREIIRKGDLVLVCDVGGGTSDFSLIHVSEEDGELALERIAVGNHLLVGGDNMDLALAHALSRRMAQKGTRLDAWQMRGLWHSCRSAKENILSDPQKDTYPVTILGRGSSLIGGTIKTELTEEEVRRVILDGFFPQCDLTAQPSAKQTIGIKEIGLAYEADPAVTHHLAHFLNQRKNSANEPQMPTAVLFNGGVMKARPIRHQILEILASWAEAGGGAAIREIESKDFDLAVARGAAYYGLARRGEGIRIRGGLGKSYYIGIAASMPAVPGLPPPIKALCVAPFGMEEGSEAALPEREFALVVGEPVKFDFLGSSLRHDDAVGTVVEDWEGEIEEITTLEATLEGEHGRVIPVTLEIKITEVGTLELRCVSREDGQKWKLEFNVRASDA
ncbi:MAG: Hsp70 family protein [Desulfobacterales bacterium]|nr:MAG: Hsp70 family protein [Desulfobacterales bacterium]